MVNGGRHNWNIGQQVKHKSEEYSKSPSCLIVVAKGEHPETGEVFYNVQWMNDKGELTNASVPQAALVPWTSVQ